MLNLIFKSSFYYMIWNKSKTQIITIAVSIALIMLIGSIYDDLYKVVKISSKDDLILLLLSL